MKSEQSQESGSTPWEFPSGLRVGFWLCVVIAVAVVVRRVVTLLSPTIGGPPQMAVLDASFAGHAGLTLAHIVPAALFVLLCPFALSRRFVHVAWVMAAFYGLGAWVGLTAYVMSGYAVGGWVERSAVMVFDTLFLWELGRSLMLRRRGEYPEAQLWLVRAIAVLLGIATTRPVMGIFFATSRSTHWEPNQFFGSAFWIGFGINTLAVELWLRFRPQPLIAQQS